MKALKAFFLSRLLTEKILLTGFLLIIAFWGLSRMARRAGGFVTEFKTTSGTLRDQDISLKGQTETEARVKRALSKLDRSRTLDSPHLQGDLNTLAVSAGLSDTTIDARPDEPAKDFIVHSVTFTARKADWKVLLQFYVELSKRAPYVSIESCSISGDRTSLTHSVTMQISSVEFAQ